MPCLRYTAALVAVLASPAFAGGTSFDPTGSASAGYAVTSCRLIDQAPVGTIAPLLPLHLLRIPQEDRPGDTTVPHGQWAPAHDASFPYHELPAVSLPDVLE